MADITLVNLNLLYMRYPDSVDKELHVPLGCLYLTRALEKAGIDVDFRDYQLFDGDDPFDMNALVEFLGDTAPVVGFSCMANLLPFTLLAMKAFGERYPDRRMILGGVGPKSVERTILDRFPWIDLIHMGEGEISGPKLLRALRDGLPLHDVPNLFFRDPKGAVVETAKETRISELDSVPFPAFEKIDLARYAGYGMMTSRGCPYPCTFCSVAPVWDYTSTYRTPANIVDEMEFLNREAGVDLFLFQDEFFLSGHKRVMAFCGELAKRKVDLQWKAFGRVNLTDVEMMQTMADAGCIELRFGIESGSDGVLKRTRKGFNTSEAVDVISKAVDIFPRTDAFYVWGFPFETMEDFYQSVFQMVSFRMMGARILPSLLCFLPQTPLYQEVRDSELFSFCENLLPEYMITGHEISTGARMRIDETHRAFFDFIQAHPDIFPGFFHYDLENNVLPKLRVLQEFGFYPGDGSEKLRAAAPIRQSGRLPKTWPRAEGKGRTRRQSMKKNRMFDGDRPEEQPSVKTTIVGGRPPGAGKTVGPIPKGLEVLVKKASVDAGFRKLLLTDGVRAAASIGLSLSDSEAAILKSLPPSALTPIIEAATVPARHRAAFLGKVAAAMLLALGVTVLPGCDPAPSPVTGIRPKDEQKIEQQETNQDGDKEDGAQTAKPTEKPVAAPEEPPIDHPVTKGIRPDIPKPKKKEKADTEENKKEDPPRTRGIRPDRPKREETEKE